MHRKPTIPVHTRPGNSQQRTNMTAALYSLELQRRTLTRRYQLVKQSLQQIEGQIEQVERQIAGMHLQYTEAVVVEETSLQQDEQFRLEY